jgi:hypothetical protein
MGDAVVAMRPAQSPDAMAVLVVGKIAARKRHNGRVHTEVRLKAPDEYTRPGVLTIGSDQPIGAVGEVVSVNCVLNGYYGGKMTRTDRQTGEVEEWFPVRMTLDAVDFAAPEEPSQQAGSRQGRPGSF